MTAMPHNMGYCPENCFGCKAASVSMSPSSMPTRSDAGRINFETKKAHADVAAYKRLRKDGLQPVSVRGAAELESRAASKWEVNTGKNLGGDAKLGAKYDAAQATISAGGTI